MPEDTWKPHTTVAAICEHNDKFLLVKELVNDQVVYNQPAGHLERGETLLNAVIRETREETRYEFTPEGLLGIYRSTPKESPDITYIRFLFSGSIGRQLEGTLDEGIISTHWMSYDEVVACKAQHRSPLVLACIDDYLQKQPYPLDVINSNFQ